MKKPILLFISFIIGLSAKSFACHCSILETITSQYQTSDFVASVKILKNYKNTPDSNEHYKADIEILDLYKGKKTKSILVFGSNGNNRFNSCGTFIDVGETRLIFGKLEKDGSISTYLCTSYYEPLKESYKNNKVAQKLNLLKKGIGDYKISSDKDTALYPYDYKQIYKPALANNYSIVKVKLNGDSEVLKITYLTKETKELIKYYDKYFKEVIDWKRRLTRIKHIKGETITLCFEINPYTNIEPKT